MQKICFSLRSEGMAMERNIILLCGRHNSQYNQINKNLVVKPYEGIIYQEI